MNGLVRYAAGSVRFEVMGGRGERFLNTCVEAGIPVEHIHPTDTGYLATVPLRDYKRMRPFARRNRCRLRVREKYGAYFALLAYRGRWGIALGLVLCALALFLGGDLIWNICFLNFTPEQETAARAMLFEQGIYEGAFQNHEILMRAASELFVESEEYGWVTLNFVKGRLVEEKTQRERPPESVSTEITNVVAVSDGIVRRIDLVDGYPSVVTGQYVARGQVLVSGMRLNSYERPMYTHAEADVWAEVENTYLYTQPLHGTSTLPTAECKSYYTLYLPWGELPLYRNADLAGTAARRVLRRPAAPLGFHLPALVEELQVRSTQPTAWTLTPEAACQIARSRILDTLRTQFGIYELLEETAEVREKSDSVTLVLRLRFLANIGEMKPFSGEMDQNAGPDTISEENP
mgnify:CR=1 FL=1